MNLYRNTLQDGLLNKLPLRLLILLVVLLLLISVQDTSAGLSPLKHHSSLAAQDDRPKPQTEKAEWWQSVQENVRQSEYHITWQEETLLPDERPAYQAPNRVHHFRTYFVSEGIQLRPRTEEINWEWGVNLTGYGYENRIQAASLAQLQPDQNRMEFNRHTLTEWYVNSEQGLEQGFTIPSRLPGARADTPLILTFSLNGNLIPTLTTNGTAIDFTTSGGVRVLRYSDLYAYDSTGKDLPAHLALSGCNTKQSTSTCLMQLVVDDSNAIYPITIDPLITLPDWAVESNQAGASMGIAVSTAGDVNGDGYADTVMGAHRYDNGQTDEGRVFVFYGAESGLPTSASWTAESDQASALFGYAVSTAGDVNGDGYADLVVGSPDYGNDQSQEGRVFVYHGSAGGLSATADWTAEGNQIRSGFGRSVAVAGDVNGDSYSDLLVGAYLYTNGQSGEGRAYLFHGSVGGLNPTPNWSVESNQGGANLGYAVDTAGDVNGDGYADAVVGAYNYDNGETDEGRVYVYHGSSSGLATTANWTAESNQASAQFGIAVGTAGDVDGDGYADLLIGAPKYDSGETDEGQAFLYYGSAGGLSVSADWTAESNQVNANFGQVSTAGDVNGDGYADLLVGSSGYDYYNWTNAGQVYAYYGGPNGVTTAADWVATGDQSNGNFGISVSLAGDINGDGYTDVLVGASGYSNTELNEGRAYLYLGSVEGISDNQAWMAESDQAQANFGYAVSPAGDVNGDGYSDVLIGAYRFDNGQINEGRTYLYYGSSAGVEATPAWTAEGQQDNALFGASVATAGDVNSDGYADVVVGSRGYTNGEAQEGRIFVYYGSATGLPTTADWTAESNQANAFLGHAVGTAGDVNGDGYSDMLAGAYNYDNGQTNEGQTYLYHGSASGLSPTPNWTAESNQANALFGYAVGTAGDVNGDGFADVIVGAYTYDNGQIDEGRAYVFQGSAGGLNTTPNWTAESDQAGAAFGRSVSTAGDVNGDGYSDVLVGVTLYDNSQIDEGRAVLYYGSAAGLNATVSWSVESNQNTANLGQVAPGGDVNGDGYADILIGAGDYDQAGLAQADAGRVYIYYGRVTGPASTPDKTIEGTQGNANFGFAVNPAGDVNGDGYSDILIGAYNYRNGEGGEGRAYVYYGSAEGISLTTGWSAESDQGYANFGYSTATAGDVNGDGFDDILVGAYRYDGGQTDAGRVYLYYGSNTGLSLTSGWTMEGDQTNAWFGFAVNAAGDVNGDGYSDILIGARNASYGETQEGRAFLYYGTPTGLSPTVSWATESNQANAFFGHSVASAGDVNGDGYADILISARGYDNGQTDEGRVYAYYGSSTGLVSAANWTAESNQANAWFGYVVNTAGDVNGDGYSDIIVGAVFYDNGEVDEGGAFVYYGSANGLSLTPNWTVESNQANANLGTGTSVSSAGDVNSDGYSDVIVGAEDYDNDEVDEGRVHLYYGSPTGLSAIPNWMTEGNQADASYGWAVSFAGDVNGDGYADVLIGADEYDTDYTDAGQVYLFYGSEAGLSLVPDWTKTSGLTTQDVDQTNFRFGHVVKTAGDVNGDGYDDILVGSPRYNNGSVEEGRVFLYYGNNGSGVSLRPRQMRTDGITPIAPAGLSDSPNIFQIHVTGHTPLGRSSVKLEWQVAPLGTPFTATNVISGISPTWTDVLTGGVTLTQTVTGLTPDTAYHWRARLVYLPGNRLGQSASRWLYPHGANETTADFRTPAGIPIANFAGAPIMGTAPLTVTFVNQSIYAADYLWDFGDGMTTTAFSSDHTYDQPGVYTVSLTANGPAGSDTLTRTNYITVTRLNNAPIITITVPAQGETVGSTSLLVAGIVTDDIGVESVLVNGVSATLNGNTFSAPIILAGGSQVINVTAQDEEGAMGFDSVVVRMDNEGPIIEIESPKNQQAVYSSHPSVTINYHDFLGTVNTNSLLVQVIDENGVPTNVTGDLVVTAEGAFGNLSTALIEDTSYTLNVSLADNRGNVNTAIASFYVPVDPTSIILPIEPADAGWVSGVVYDSSTCDEHLTACQGMPGVAITFSYEDEPNNLLTGKIVSGPDGFFAFPFAQTGIYWLRAEKEGYTYSQREVIVVKERSAAANEIYLTPIDTALTPCTQTGCSHQSVDGQMQVIIPAGAITSGDVVEVTATQFDRVYFLPSGELPPGTWETYAFNLGGDSHYQFQQPVTVKIQNSIGFAPGTQIPLGYWNPDTFEWEDKGFAAVDATGQWVEMQVMHFSNYDANMMYQSLSSLTVQIEDLTEEDDPCADGESGCFINYKSGRLQEWVDLPAVNVLGESVMPQLRYSTERANSTVVIDVGLNIESTVGNIVGDYVQWELYIEGEKTALYTIAADLDTEGTREVGRYRLLWDGRNAQGELLPPGVYQYSVRMRFPYQAEYCSGLGFGASPDCINFPTGIFVTATMEKWVYGTLALKSETNSAFGDGWTVNGWQRLYTTEDGNILITDGQRSDEFYFEAINQLPHPNSGESVLAWVNYSAGTLQTVPTESVLSSPPTTINLGLYPKDVVVSADGTRAYALLTQEFGGSGSNILSVVDLANGTVIDTYPVGNYPHSVALSPDQAYVYVTNSGDDTLSIINLLIQQVSTISVGDDPQTLAISPSGSFAYVVISDDVGSVFRKIVKIDLGTQTIVGTSQTFGGSSGTESPNMALNASGGIAYVITQVSNDCGYENGTLIVVDLVDLTVENTISLVGPGEDKGAFDVAFSPDESVAYATTGVGGCFVQTSGVSVVDLENGVLINTVDLGSGAKGIVLSLNGQLAYVAKDADWGNNDIISVVNLVTLQEVGVIDVGLNSGPTSIAISGVSPASNATSRTDTDFSTLVYDGDTSTYTRIYPNGKQVHFDVNGRHDHTLYPNGRKLSYTYNPDGTIATMNITAPGETTPHWTWTFNYLSGKLTHMTDPTGRNTEFTVDDQGQLTQVAFPDDSTEQFFYDSQGLLTQHIEPTGGVTSYTYDAYGRLQTNTGPIRTVYNPETGQTTAASEVRIFTPSDTTYPLLNGGPVGDPDNPAPAAPTSADLIDGVTYGEGSVTGRTNEWGNWLEVTDGTNRTITYERDEANNVTGMTLPNSDCLNATYDNNGNLLTTTRMDAMNCGLSQPLDVQTTAYTYELRFNQIKTYTDAEGNITTYIYDYEEGIGEQGLLIRVEHPVVEDENGIPTVPTVSYTYNSWGLLETETDARGTATRYMYTQGTSEEASNGTNPLFAPGVTPVPGLLTSVIQDDGGFNLTTTYKDFNALGNPMTIIVPGGNNVTHYVYDEMGRVTSQTDAVGIVTLSEYDNQGHLVRRIADYTPDGVTGHNVVTIYTYNTANRLINERTAADGLVVETNYFYDINGNLTRQVDGLGHVTTFFYDDANRLISQTDPTNEATFHTYDDNGRLESVTDADGYIHRTTYDQFGRTESQIQDENGLDLTTSYTYDLNNNLLTVTAPDGTTNCYEYDSHNRRTAEVQDCGPGGESLRTEFAYDLNGNLIYTTDYRGVVTYNEYDALNRLRLTRQADGDLNLETTYTYNVVDGNLESTSDERGIITSYTYGDLNRLETNCQDTGTGGLNICTTYGYDRLGNQQSVTNPDGVTTFTEYNAFGLPVQIIADYGVGRLNATTSFGYNNALNQVRYTDTNGNSTLYTYTPRNQVASEQYADGTTVAYTYDGRGNIQIRTNQSGHIFTYLYDGVSRPTTISFSTGGQQAFSYDEMGRVIQATETLNGHTSTVVYDYNNLGDLNFTYQTIDGVGGTAWQVNYSYDYLNGTYTVFYPSGARRDYALDPLGRLDVVLDNNAILVADYDYQDVASFMTVEFGNGVIGRTDYDSLRRIEEVQATQGATTLADYVYGYDSVGNRTFMQRVHKSGVADVYQYDNLYQLTQLWYGANNTNPQNITSYDTLQTYDLDGVGNRLEVTVDDGSQVTPQLYGPHNGQQLTNSMNRYEEVDGSPLAYDERGNTLADGITDHSYSYDILNRQIAVDETTEYLYDAMGRRVAKIVDGVTTYYLYDKRFRVIEERDSSNNWTARYTYGGGIDEILTMERGGNTYYYHRDALGNVTEVTNSGGNLVERYEYDVYGKPFFFDGNYAPLAASFISNPYLFTGREYDPESGNYYYRARIYSPALGRFLSMDPMGYGAGDANLYRYVFNNPVNLTDPSGLIVDTVLDVAFITYDIYVLVEDIREGCEDDLGENLLALGLDIGGALLPFVTGGGLAVRVASKADDISDATRMLNIADSATTGTRQVFDPEKLERIIANLRKQGVGVIMNEEAARFLRSGDAGAMYWPRIGRPGLLIFQPNPSRLEVIEELIHLGQHRHVGWIKASREVVFRMEVEAQQKMLSLAEHLKWTPDDLKRIQDNLEYWLRKLNNTD